VADRAAAISQATFCTLIRDHHKSGLLEIRLALDHGHRTATLHTRRSELSPTFGIGMIHKHCHPLVGAETERGRLGFCSSAPSTVDVLLRLVGPRRQWGAAMHLAADAAPICTLRGRPMCAEVSDCLWVALPAVRVLFLCAKHLFLGVLTAPARGRTAA
jgi:hypothetical protein